MSEQDETNAAKNVARNALAAFDEMRDERDAIGSELVACRSHCDELEARIEAVRGHIANAESYGDELDPADILSLLTPESGD